MDKNIKNAVYVALTGGLFYYAAKHLKTDVSLALFFGSIVGQILATDSNNQKKDNYVFK